MSLTTALGIGGLALSLGSSIWGGISSSARNREAEREMARQKAKDDAWYARRYNEDYLDTAAGQNLMRQARDYADSRWKKAQGASIVGGATEATSAMAKEAGNKVVSDTVANIAAQDVARKTNVDNIHHADEQRYTQQRMALNQQRASDIATAAAGLSDAGMKLAGLGLGDTTDDKGKTNSTQTKNSAMIDNSQ